MENSEKTQSVKCLQIFQWKIQSQLSFKLYLCVFLRQERNRKWLVITVLQRVYTV